MIDYYLRGANQFEEKKYSDFVDLTLKNISYGGINDHIEGGLHRYTVDSCLLYTSPSPRDRTRSRMPSSA